MKFQVDKAHPEYSGELVRLVDQDQEIFILRHPSLYVNERTKNIEAMSETTIFHAKHINECTSLVSAFTYLTDDAHQIIEGNPGQTSPLREKGMKNNNETSFFGMKAKTVKWEIWFKNKTGDLVNFPFPEINEQGRVTLPDISLDAVDLRTLDQIYMENSGSTEDGLDLVDLESLRQDAMNVSRSKLKYLLDKGEQGFRLSEVSLSYLKQTSKDLVSMRPGLISKELRPLLPGDMDILFSNTLKKLTAQQIFK